MEAEVEEFGDGLGQALDNEARDHGGEANEDAEAMLLLSKARCASEDATILNHRKLQASSNDEDTEEVPVLADSLEGVEVLISHISAVDEVEDMHPDEDIEQHSECVALVGRLTP